MEFKNYKCINCVDEHSGFIKYGKTNLGKQRYQCKTCKRLALFNIHITHIKEILIISTTTLLKRIIIIAKIYISLLFYLIKLTN